METACIGEQWAQDLTICTDYHLIAILSHCRALAHVRPVPNTALRLSTGEDRCRESARVQRAELSAYLLAAVESRRQWLLDSDDFTRIYDQRQEREVPTTPTLYAEALLAEGLEGHFGETPELNLFARRNQINVIVVARNTVIDAVDPRDVREQNHDNIQAVYRVRNSDEPDVHHNVDNPVSITFVQMIYG